MATEYKFTKLPKGIVPKSVGYEAVVSMELTELAAEGWRVVTTNRLGQELTPLDVVLERTTP